MGTENVRRMYTLFNDNLRLKAYLIEEELNKNQNLLKECYRTSTEGLSFPHQRTQTAYRRGNRKLDIQRVKRLIRIPGVAAT